MDCLTNYRLSIQERRHKKAEPGVGPNLTAVLLSQRSERCTVYRFRPGSPAGLPPHFPPSAVSSPSAPLRATIEKFRPHPSHLGSALGPQNGGPNWETNEARGGGSCTGPVEVNRGPLMTSGTLYRPGRPRISLRPLSSPSVPHHLYRGPKSRGRNFKSSPCTHRTGSALAHRTAGPTGKRRRRGAGVPARGRSK